MSPNEYIQYFLEEATMISQEIGQCLLTLENTLDDTSVIDRLFRSIHTMKGSSLTLFNLIEEANPDDTNLKSLKLIGTLSHKFEDFLSKVRDDGQLLKIDQIDSMFQISERIEGFLTDISQNEESSNQIDDLISILSGWLSEETVPAKENNSSITPVTQETTQEESIETTTNTNTSELWSKETSDMNQCNFELFLNIPETHITLAGAYLSKIYREIQTQYPHAFFSPSIEDLMSQDNFQVTNIYITVFSHHVKEPIISFVESLKYVKNINILSFQTPAEKKELKQKEEEIQNQKNKKSQQNQQKKAENSHPIKSESNETIRVPMKRINELLKNVSELVIAKNKFKNLAPQVHGDIAKDIQDIADEINKIVTDLQNGTMSIRMTPIEQLFGRFPVDVRKVSKELGKKISFSTDGGTTEIDKALLDQLFDPLMHLVRNSIVHGLESEEERLKKGKSKDGHITLRARHEQGFVVIEVEDDGRGIDIEQVTKKAIDRGTLTAEKASSMTQSELAELIFQPGLSTAEKVSNVAGRGVGMDSVQDDIKNKMQGQIEILTEAQVGTTIRIKLPLTLSIISANFTHVNNEVFAFPSSYIYHFTHLPIEKIRYIGNKEFFLYREKEIPIIHMRDYFNLPKLSIKPEILKLVVIQVGNKFLALVVDDFGDKMNIVVRSVHNQFVTLDGIGGCFVLPNGDIGLIVDPNSLVATYSKKNRVGD
ncbi:chemotaxis protein CheA [Bacillus cereus]